MHSVQCGAISNQKLNKIEDEHKILCKEINELKLSLKVLTYQSNFLMRGYIQKPSYEKLHEKVQTLPLYFKKAWLKMAKDKQNTFLNIDVPFLLIMNPKQVYRTER